MGDQLELVVDCFLTFFGGEIGRSANPSSSEGEPLLLICDVNRLMEKISHPLKILMIMPSFVKVVYGGGWRDVEGLTLQ